MAQSATAVSGAPVQRDRALTLKAGASGARPPAEAEVRPSQPGTFKQQPPHRTLLRGSTAQHAFL